MKKQITGFTLVEIMIVAGVVVLLAAISIPAIIRQRVAANESAAVASMRSISVGAQNYYTDNGYYPERQVKLGSNPMMPSAYCAALNGYINDRLACPDEESSRGCSTQGYRFMLYGGPSGCNNITVLCSTFWATGRPLGYGFTGKKSFFVDQGGAIHWTSANRAATANDPPIQ